MKWVTYRSSDGSQRCGLVTGGQILGSAAGVTMLDVLRSADGLRGAAALLEAGADEVIDLDRAHLMAPIPVPPSVRDFAAFERHVSQAARSAIGDGTVSPAWYEAPVFYFSNPAAIQGPYDDVPIPTGTVSLDYEVEVAAVIAHDCSDLDPETAEDHIAGYLVYCDWTSRDRRLREFGFVFGPTKSKDSVTSTGPYLVTPEELEPYRSGKGYRLGMRALVNGEEYGGGSWDEIHWSFGELLAHASFDTVLRAGDMVASGAVGDGCIQELTTQSEYLRVGDRVRVEVELLGAVEARVVPRATGHVDA
jgi:2-keto-4-pentenoate hydratase/2-oxohepta-3-ene-1,7-dioic acid hydratase in catechol pathway